MADMENPNSLPLSITVHVHQREQNSVGAVEKLTDLDIEGVIFGGKWTTCWKMRKR